MCQRKKKQNASIQPYHRAPAYQRTNPYIIKGYRVNLSVTQCFRSVLMWSNETLNIWSHIAGFLVFLGLFIYDVMVVYHKYHGTEDDAVVASFVLVCFMMCMLLSSLYHTLNCTSEESCMKWLAYDVFGISASFLAIFLSGIYYAFWCPEHYYHRIFYSSLVFILFSGAMVLILTPKFMGADWEWLRVALFSGWAVSGVLPLAHWLHLFYGTETNIVSVFLPRIIMMYIISGLAVFIFIFKIPERYYPGRFDYIGASHQLWHLIIVIALVYWHQTGLEYARFRLTFGCTGAISSN